MINITLNDIRKYRPCEPGWKKLLSSLGKTKADDEPIPLEYILNSNGLDDAIWCLRVLPDGELKNIQQLAIDIANTVRNLMADQRSTNALDVAQKYLDGNVTVVELRAACAAAYAAASAARVAYAVPSAARSAYAAARAAHAAATATAADAAYKVTAAFAAYAAASAARVAYAGTVTNLEELFIDFCKKIRIK